MEALEYIKARLVKIDPTVQKFTSTHRSEPAYTVWHPIRPIGIHANGARLPGWSFQIDRYTKQDPDEIAAEILKTLEADNRVAVDYLLDYEDDTGYFHHIFDCEVV